MDKKVLVMLLILLTGTSLFVSGCADRKNAGGGVPTTTPNIVATVTPIAEASAAPVGAPTTTAPTVTPAPGQTNAPSGGQGLDPSLADISGEGDDLTGFPETGLPTPTLD
jgi:hypothetical protein